MTKEESKYAVSVMNAYINGKKIEYVSRADVHGTWREIPHPRWEWDVYNYRVAEDSVTRPYKNVNEYLTALMSNGPYLKHVDGIGKTYVYCVVHADDEGVLLGSGDFNVSYEQLAKDFVWARNGSPCGVDLGTVAKL